MRNGTLYFHSPCFDGLVSATLAWVYLELKDWHFEQFSPVNYEILNTWLSAPLETPAAVVDFLYHPKADFWADHHPTTFLRSDIKDDFIRRRHNTCLIFDERAGSCASLLWNRLRLLIPNAERYEEVVFWAEKIDGADYASVDEAIWGDSPALRIKQSLGIQDEVEYYRLLITELRSGELGRVAELAAVRKRCALARQRVNAGVVRAKEHVKLCGEVVVMDVELSDVDTISRYTPYHFFPMARYSIGILRSTSRIAITAMRNPWINFRSIHLGNILTAFGGGGHERVGSVLIPITQLDRVDPVVDRLLYEMQSQSLTESVPV